MDANNLFQLDIFNYLSIMALEQIGILDPTEQQIILMEKVLRLSLRGIK